MRHPKLKLIAGLMAVLAYAQTVPPTTQSQADELQQKIQQLLKQAVQDGYAQGLAAATPPSNITAVWANEGGDKVSRDELRATNHKENLTGTVLNRAWDGTTIKISGARNEIVSFNLVIEAANAKAAQVSVSFDTLTGPNTAKIATTAPAAGNGVFNWVNRPIELFYARYVEIQGLSFFGYYKGDERQIPVRFQAPSHAWKDRPDHNKFYPDALVPLELVQKFDIAQGQNQSIFADIYVPKGTPAGVYTGQVKISEGSTVTKTIPVSLTVKPFTLPDAPNAKTFVNLDANDIVWRWLSPDHHYVNWASSEGLRAVRVTDRYYELFHRHKIGVVGDNDCPVADHPCDTSMPRLNGSLFTGANGYDGPGANTPNDIYSIGTYGTWGAAQYGVPYWKDNQAYFNQHIDAWESWFSTRAPWVEHFIYLADEPSLSCNSPYCTTVAQVEQWAAWVHRNPGPGKDLLTMSTYNAVPSQTLMPDLDIPVTPGGIGSCPSGQSTCNNTATGQAAADYYGKTAGKRNWWYNDGRPGSGTFVTEDEGVGPRTIPWAQMKLGISRWYYWFANVGQGGGNWFTNAVTWGSTSKTDGSLGLTGDDGTSNGNGLLVYPGTDLGNAADSYGVDGPIASLRLKAWRRGIQDADYIALARQIDSPAANAVVASAMPKALWENPAPGGDPSYFVGSVSWSSNPDDWEAKREQLAQIISTYCGTHSAAAFCQ